MTDKTIKIKSGIKNGSKTDIEIPNVPFVPK